MILWTLLNNKFHEKFQSTLIFIMCITEYTVLYAIIYDTIYKTSNQPKRKKERKKERKG